VSKPFSYSHHSWQENFQQLAQIPTQNPEDEKLLHFLQERWLAKVAGFSSFAIDWVYPCFGIQIQTHPGTNHSYARLLTSHICNAYTQRMEAWKSSLPHPSYFPLILTRPLDPKEYFPSYVEVSSLEEIPQLIAEDTLFDVSPLFSESPDRWMNDWDTLAPLLTQACLDSKIDPEKIMCLQRVDQEDIGGLRLLHLKGQSQKGLEKQHQMLLEWLSALGLGANRVELDRWPAALSGALSKPVEKPSSALHAQRQTLLAILALCNQNWNHAPSYKKVMLQGALHILQGLLAQITEEKWAIIETHPTKEAVVSLALSKIQKELDHLAQNTEIPFQQLTGTLETIHADLSSLLEVLTPFTADHFPPIYRNLLYAEKNIPQDLFPLTSCGIHTSGMASLAAIVKAAEKTVGQRPSVLYGDNTYFECAHFMHKVTDARSMNDATDEDWAKADLLVAQFNPVLKLRGDFAYKVEEVAESLRKCLKAKNQAPLTLALDCTIDFLHSPHVENLLAEFAPEIQQGTLNLIGFRSGNKFDLFGMDNYCGAPLFMVHSGESKWHFFDDILTEKGIQADRLSLQWFCSAYQFASAELDLYRKHIFANTRSLLSQVPKTLLDSKAPYHVSPAEPEADLAFLDIKVTGPFNAYKCSAFVAAPFFLTNLEAGHPMFNRPSLGFYHANCKIHFIGDCSVIRLTLGLDPSEVDLFASCLQKVAEL